MKLPLNPHDPDPWLRAEIRVANLLALAQRHRMHVRDLRAVRKHDEADRLDLRIAEWEVEAEAMRAQLDALKYNAWLLSHRQAA